MVVVLGKRASICFNRDNWVWGRNTLSLWLPLKYSKKKGIELNLKFKVRLGSLLGIVIVECSAINRDWKIHK